jgi:hypothetical protein
VRKKWEIPFKRGEKVESCAKKKGDGGAEKETEKRKYAK